MRWPVSHLRSPTVTDQSRDVPAPSPAPDQLGANTSRWRRRLVVGASVVALTASAVIVVLLIVPRGDGRDPTVASVVTASPSTAQAPRASWEAVTVTGAVGEATVVSDGRRGRLEIALTDVEVRASCGTRAPQHGSFLVVSIDVVVAEGHGTIHSPEFYAIRPDGRQSMNLGPLLSGCEGPKFEGLRDAPTGTWTSGTLVFDAPTHSQIALRARWGRVPAARWVLG